MKSVSQILYYAGHRFGIIHRAGGRLVPRKPSPLVGNSVDGGCDKVIVKEFAAPGGAILSRKVTRGNDVECWLRRDIADAAQAALDAEDAEAARVIGVMADFIRDTDMAGAIRNDMTVEEYRRDRHARGARWDKYRAKQRAGF
jgi:hypothetical protein